MAIVSYLLIFNILQLCVSINQIWHSYQYDPVHENREEFVITNITSEDEFKLDYLVTKWKSICLEKMCYAAGLMEKSVVIASITLNTVRDGFLQESYQTELQENPVDIALFQHWNSSSKQLNVIAVMVTEKSELLWYKIGEIQHELIWIWPIQKDISHINVFQIERKFKILMIVKYGSEITVDLYEFELHPQPNFWLHQKIELSDQANTSTVINFGLNYYLAIPQKSLSTLLVYRFENNHFKNYKSLKSSGIDDVISFRTPHKSFLAFNGLNAGIYRFTQNDLIREKIVNSHLDSVNYWLPMSVTTSREDTVLIAQRSLDHGLHKSFVIEIITYNGDKFEEHEDIPCLYFGDNVLGLSCLPGEKTGMSGAAQISINGVLGLLIPRDKSFSEMFVVHTEIVKNQNPVHIQLENLMQQRQHLDNLIKEQEKRYQLIVATPRQVLGTSTMKRQLKEMNQYLDLIKDKLEAKEDSTHYTTIIFNGMVEVTGEANFEEVEVSTIKEETANEVLTDIVLRDNVVQIESPKTFRRLEIDDLNFEKVNNITAKDMVFATDGIILNNNLVLTKSLTIHQNATVEELNGKHFESEVVDLHSPTEELVFENIEIVGDVEVDEINYRPLSLTSEGIRLDPTNIELDSLWVPHNIITKNLNNENFDQFLRQLCLKNIKTDVPGLIKVDGNIHVKENAKLDYLKEVKFPQEYVFKHNSSPNITGQKYFNKTLITSELNCEGTVDDIQTSKVITLSTNQAVSGTTIFKQLKVTESLDVGGKVLGKHASKFLPNPLLSESDLIKANVHFKDLEVEGDIILRENFNGENFQYILSDIVYADEENPVIAGMKQFPEGLTVRTNLIITSNSINDIDLNSVVTKDTDQFLNITTLHGIVNFGNVDVDGLYDSVDIRELDENIVKLEGEQYISSTLVFENDLSVNELEIIETINHLSEDEFLPVNEQLENSNEIDSLRFLNVTVDGNIYGDIDGFSLEDFDSRRLSFTKDQVIEAHYNIIESLVERMELVKMNDVEFNDLTKDSLLDKMRYKLHHENLNVTNLHIIDSVEIDRINNETTTNLGGSLWKNDAKPNLTFNGATYFESIQIEKLSSVNFTRFISVLVLKNETNPKISGRKIFLDGMTVKKLIEIDKLNNITLSNILTKEGTQEILGPVIIHGNVTFDSNITLHKNINDIPVTLITDNYQVNDDGYQINGDILFNRLSYIYNLEIRGYVDDKFAQKTIDKIVYKGGDFKLEGHTIFENKVNIEGNIRVINKTNNIDLAGFASDMVMVTKDTDIKSPVIFKEAVHVENRITLVNDLKARTLNGIDLNSWMENAIFIDRGQLEGNFMLEDVEIVDHLYTNYINDINLNSLIPLRTQQNITEMSFDEITSFNDIIVGNSTNYHNLLDEFSNTVLMSADQEIVSDVEFLGNVFIEGNMEILGRINNMETSTIVTTNTDQNLNAIYNFNSKTILEKNLEVEGLVNGINMTTWMSEGIKTLSHLPQNITDNWHIEQDLIFENDTKGRSLINGVDMQQFQQEVEDKRNHQYAVEKGFIDDYLNICKDLTYMYDKLKKQIYKFNYLEKLQEMSFQNKLHHVYHFQHGNDFYLLVTEDKSCESYLFIFNMHFRFVKSVPFGLISQMISVRNNDLLYFVIRSEPVCEVQGTNLWQVTDHQLVHLAIIEDQEILQDSMIPATFYGISGHTVTEFKIAPKSEFVVAKHRKWEVREENMAFVPRGLSTGLAIRTGKKLIRLNRDDPSFNDINYETETIIRGNFTEEFNTYLPGRKDGDLVVMKVGIKSSKRSLVAVASHEETSVKGSLDFIKIYEDAVKGKVFHKVPTYKPSSLVALEFHNGETLLTFMEDESVLQVYEYKGIEGFKHKLSVKLGGSELFAMTLQINKTERRVLGLIDENRISFMEAVMLGNQIEDGLQCSL